MVEEGQDVVYFNSRPCERGFDLLGSDTIVERIFQFTPLREGLPTAITIAVQKVFISIHAPARGAS